jgi:hypothetical protein
MIRNWLSIFQKENFKKTLGRWCTEQNNKKIVNRIDWANEDHCGACGDSFKNITHRKSDIYDTEKLTHQEIPK